MASAVTQAPDVGGGGVQACLGGLDGDGNGVSGEGRWPWRSPQPILWHRPGSGVPPLGDGEVNVLPGG